MDNSKLSYEGMRRRCIEVSGYRSRLREKALKLENSNILMQAPPQIAAPRGRGRPPKYITHKSLSPSKRDHSKKDD